MTDRSFGAAAMPDAATQIARTILNRIAAKDANDHAAALEEIRRRGTWWAAEEIARLRRRVASMQTELRRHA